MMPERSPSLQQIGLMNSKSVEKLVRPVKVTVTSITIVQQILRKMRGHVQVFISIKK